MNKIISITNDIEFEWKDITEDMVPGVKPFYKISNYGVVYGKTWNRFMHPSINNSGYLVIGLAKNEQFENGRYKKAYLTMNNLVARAFIPRTEEDIRLGRNEVNHIDGNTLHNWVSNLEWVTKKENMEHAYKTGLCGYGENSNSYKLSAIQVEQICSLIDKGYSYQRIAEIVGEPATKSNIFCIANAITWFSVSCNYSFIYNSVCKLFTSKQIEMIIDLCNTTPMSDIEMLSYVGIDISNMSYNDKRRYLNCINKIIMDVEEKF